MFRTLTGGHWCCFHFRRRQAREVSEAIRYGKACYASTVQPLEFLDLSIEMDNAHGHINECSSPCVCTCNAALSVYLRCLNIGLGRWVCFGGHLFTAAYQVRRSSGLGPLGPNMYLGGALNVLKVKVATVGSIYLCGYMIVVETWLGLVLVWVFTELVL
jgi:hypothetical protein